MGQKHHTFREFRKPSVSPRYIRKNPRSMYARVPHMMARFVLKIEKLSRIIGTAPILEMARVYGLCSRIILICYAELNVDSYGVSYNRAVLLSRKKKIIIQSKTIQWIKSRNICYLPAGRSVC